MKDLIYELAVTEKHAKMVHTVRNHPEIRSQLINTDVIPFEKHLSYFNLNIVGNEDFQIFVALSEDTCIGFFDLKIEKEDGTVEIGVKLLPAYQGLGLGREIFIQGIKICKERYSQYKIILTVFGTNEKASSLYDKIGFVQTGDEMIGERKLIHMELIDKGDI